MLVLNIAAWFHDTGHLFQNKMKDHEEKSVEVMQKFMNDNSMDKDLIDRNSCLHNGNENTKPSFKP